MTISFVLFRILGGIFLVEREIVVSEMAKAFLTRKSPVELSSQSTTRSGPGHAIINFQIILSFNYFKIKMFHVSLFINDFQLKFI